MQIKHLKISFISFVTNVVSSWLTVSSALLLIFPEAGISVSFQNGISIALFGATVIVSALLLTVFDTSYPTMHISAYTFVASVILFILFDCIKQSSMTTYTTLVVVLLIVLYCFEKKYKPSLIHMPIESKSTVIIIASVAAVFACAVVCSISVLRYNTFSSPNYDFGIFCNMFYNMKESGRAVSTCERDRLLSHFAVHVSPIYYIILPVYMIFSSPITLAVLQPIVIFSSIIPIYLLSRHFKISNNATSFMCIAVALFTPLSSGCFYDLHENCFLVPLLLWMFYFFEKDKVIPMSVFLVLTLLVKEDAFIYIAFFSLYAIVSRKKYLRGGLMLVFAGAYFLFVSSLMSKYGLGIMSSRYGNISADGSLFSAAKTILVNPGCAISEVLKTEDESMKKVFYLVQLFAPLGFIPFMNKDLTRFILILPIFINLLTEYVYQYDITFQYTFGICAFLIYISIMNLSEMKERQQTNHSFTAIVMSAVLFSMIVLPKLDSYVNNYRVNKESFQLMTQALEVIPEDASVTASTYILPHLASRKVIYEDEYHEAVDTDYFVLDLRYSVSKGRADKYIEAGYELIEKVPNKLEIYQKK